MRYTTLAAAGLAFVLVATGCARTTEMSPLAAQAPDVEPAQWGICAPAPPLLDDAEAREVLASAQCATVDVPLDYDDPDGATASIAMLRLPATGDRIGSLFVSPGGAGFGIRYLSGWPTDIPAELRERFDVIGFDRRGAGRSTPAYDCNSDTEEDAERADADVDYTPDGIASIENEARRFVDRCVANTDPDLLANAGTDATVRDLDLLRAAVGDDQLTFYGLSTGTRVGSEYAETFPDKVRAMVLDAAIDPSVGGMQWPIDQAAAQQQVFIEYAEHCATQPSCPLGSDPARAAEKLRALLRPLASTPAPTDDPRGLSYDDAVTAVDYGLFPPEYWPGLSAGLTAIQDGEPADVLLEYADDYHGRDEDGRYTNENDAVAIVDCTDNRYSTEPKEWAEFDENLRNAAPYRTFGEYTGHAPQRVCSFWPHQSDDEPHPASAPGLPTTLVLSTTLDPVTPYADGVRLADQLDARLVTMEGIQHGAAFWGNACVDDIVNAYLIELELPSADPKCTSEFTP